MNWQIIWKKCKERIFPYAKRANDLENVVKCWCNMYEASNLEVQRLRSENQKLQDKLKELSVSFNELTQKYENLLACQGAKITVSNPPAADPDFWDSDWNNMTTNIRRWWDKHCRS